MQEMNDDAEKVETEKAEGMAEALAEGVAGKDEHAVQFLPRFHKGELVPVKGYWFSVLGTTRGEGHLVLQMNGPTNATLKKIAHARKQK